jgi:hypothetical protein
MTTHQLAAMLLSGPDLPAIIQKDSEGNGYSPLAGIDAAFYVADTTWSGEAYREEDKPDDAVPCVVLYPVN